MNKDQRDLETAFLQLLHAYIDLFRENQKLEQEVKRLIAICQN